MFNLDDDNLILLSPHHEKLREEIKTLLDQEGIQSHVALLSSGTTSENPKGYALSKNALMEHAKAVNQLLGLKSEDRWGLTLPPYHIGGLGIQVRSQLLNQVPVNLYPWNLESIPESIRNEHVSVISLVPTQIYDLVKKCIPAPKSLRIVLVGGDFLGEELEKRAIDLGWPIRRTFGMTEVGSQLATGGNHHQGLDILPIHQVKQDQTQRLWVKTPTLFTLEFRYQNGWNIQFAREKFDTEGFYPLEDKVQIQGNRIIPLGRMDGSFKMSGRLISFLELRNVLDKYNLEQGIWGKLELSLQADPRLGQQLILNHDVSISQQEIQKFLDLIHPIKIQKIISGIKRTELGKVQLR